jgi:hypothetical protein
MSLINPEQIQGGGTGGGITPAQHETLRQIIHFIQSGPGDGFASGAYEEILPSGSIFPTSVIWYVDSSKAQKIFEKLITWDGVVPSVITYNMYATDGITIIHSATDTISYVNVIFETSRTRTIF